jgi:hypothetical protein
VQHEQRVCDRPSHQVLLCRDCVFKSPNLPSSPCGRPVCTQVLELAWRSTTTTGTTAKAITSMGTSKAAVTYRYAPGNNPRSQLTPPPVAGQKHPVEYFADTAPLLWYHQITSSYAGGFMFLAVHRYSHTGSMPTDQTGGCATTPACHSVPATCCPASDSETRLRNISVSLYVGTAREQRLRDVHVQPSRRQHLARPLDPHR